MAVTAGSWSQSKLCIQGQLTRESARVPAAEESLHGQRWSWQQGSFRRVPPTQQPVTLASCRQHLKGSPPVFSPRNTETFPEGCRAGVGVSSQLIALSSLSLAPHNLEVGVGLTSRFKSCKLLKMLMRKKRPQEAPSADVGEELGRAMACLSGNFLSTSAP